MNQIDDCRPAGRAACLLRCELDKPPVQRWLDKHGLNGDLYSVNDLDRLIEQIGDYQCIGLVDLDILSVRQAHRLLVSAFMADVDIWTTSDVYVTDILHDFNSIQCEIVVLAEHLSRLPRFFPSEAGDYSDFNHPDAKLWGGIGVLDQWLINYRSTWLDEYRNAVEVLTGNLQRLKQLIPEPQSELPIYVVPEQKQLVIRGKTYQLNHDLLPAFLDQIIRAQGEIVSRTDLKNRSKALKEEQHLERLFPLIPTPTPARYFESKPGRGYRLKTEMFSQ